VESAKEIKQVKIKDVHTRYKKKLSDDKSKINKSLHYDFSILPPQTLT
jgi:hypothetical protein